MGKKQMERQTHAQKELLEEGLTDRLADMKTCRGVFQRKICIAYYLNANLY
jgi:hypothetical protein